MKFFKGDMGSAICEDCKKKRRQLCALCKQPTAKTEIVNVTGIKIHTHCFRCNICDASLLAGYVQVKGEYLCIAHRDAEPVARNWADPNDKGPGVAPKKAVVQYGPNAEDRRKLEEKKRKEEQLRQMEQRRLQEEKIRSNTEVELNLLNALLDDTIESVKLEDAPPDDEEDYKAPEEFDENFDYSRYKMGYDANDDKARASEKRRTTVKSRQTQQRQTKQYEDEDEDGDYEQLEGTDVFEKLDRPDWQKEREREERGSFRTNARLKQQELDKDRDLAYYSMSDEDEDEIKMQVSYTQKRQTQQRRKN